MKLGFPLEGQGNEVRNVSLEILATAPTAGLYAGRTYYDTTLKVERTYTGTAWTNKDGTSTALNNIGAPTGAVSLNGQKVTSLATPTAASDAANKGYIDGLLTALNDDWHAPVRAASTANVSIAAPGGTLDSVTLATGDRILLKDQTTASQNGIWVFNGAGTALTRPSDWVTGQVKSGDAVIAAEGATYDNQQFILSTNGTITVDTTAIAFVQPTGGGVTRTSLGATGKYATTVGDAATTVFTINHALGTTDVQVKTYSTDSAGIPTDEFLADVKIIDAANVRVTVSMPVPAAAGNAGRMRVVVVG